MYCEKYDTGVYNIEDQQTRCYYYSLILRLLTVEIESIDTRAVCEPEAIRSRSRCSLDIEARKTCSTLSASSSERPAAMKRPLHDDSS